MPPLHQKVLTVLQALPPSDQQEVLDFVEFLKAKRQNAAEATVEQNIEKVSFLAAACQFIGCAEGPADLSTNDIYMEGYGA